jgi:hypothetical protein
VKRISALIAGVLVAFPLLHSQQSAPTEASGKRLKLISLSQVKEYPPAPNTALRAKAGYVFVAVCFVPVPLKSVDDYVDDQSAILIDSAGAKTGAVYTNLVGSKTINGNAVPEYQCLLFPMKETMKPRAMNAGGMILDLASRPTHSH